jgi:hypothetical protein
MDMIKRFPHRALQVEELRLLTCLPSSFNKRTLLNTFPNVRVLEVGWDQGPLEESHEFKYFRELIEITSPQPKIRVLRDTLFCELASQMLASNLGHRLGELQLDFEGIDGISTRTIVDQLKNLPVLKTLTLHELYIGINDLEKIHTDLPTIQEFDLCIHITASEMPSNVLPATFITKLDIQIDSAFDVNTHIQFYQYMLKKYSSVKVIEYIDRMILYCDPDDARRVYLNGILDFYKLVVPSKTLAIQGVPNYVNVFEVFDGMGHQFEELRTYQCEGETLFQYLAESKQARCIKKLDLSATKISTPRSLKNTMALTTLKLSPSYSENLSIDLTDHLNGYPPTLRNLSIDCHDLNIDLAVTQLSNIETLDISCHELTKDLGDVISASFPKLAQLKLSASSLCEDVNITIQTQSLKIADIFIPPSCIYGFSFKSPNQADPQLYGCFKGTQECVLYSKIRYLPIITFTSFTERKLIFTRCITIRSV